jgi:hypothetical protein
MKKVWEMDIGDTVICDRCNEDFTGSEVAGGCTFGSRGYCPECAPAMIASAIKYGETEYLTICPPTMSFWKFILKARKGDNRIILWASGEGGEDEEE